ncbi:hypothetical protein QPK13_13140 [Photorhabdus tasmaniensis]
MFKIIVTTTNHRSGIVKKEVIRFRYKTYQGAEKAAKGLRRVCMPDGKTITVTVDAEIVEVKRA